MGKRIERQRQEERIERGGQSLPDKRAARRRRRKRSEILSYTVLILLIAVFAVGIVLGVRELVSRSRGDENTEDTQDKVEELFSSEGELKEPEPVSSEPSVPELTDAQKLDQIVNAGIEVMPLEDKVAGLFIVTPEAITGVSTAVQAGDGTKEALSKYAVGGLVYFGKNIQSKEQVSEMIENTCLYSNYPLFIAVDEEGGSVSRVAEAGLAEKAPSPGDIAAGGDAAAAYQAGISIGGYLAELGFNLNFAPVADLANVEGSCMEGRSYGGTAESAIPYVTAVAEGLKEQGITPCLKHFPGIGSSGQDTHDGMASTERTLEEFRAEEFGVFAAGTEAGAEMIMVGHMAAPALTGDNTPCSLSEAVVTELLRNELGFDGVVITDALNMSAVKDYHDSAEAAVLALRAGCDMLLMPEDFEAAYQGVLQAVQEGTISEERIDDALRRIYRIKYADRVGGE